MMATQNNDPKDSLSKQQDLVERLASNLLSGEGQMGH